MLPRVPSRPAADIQAGHGAAGQELADRAHRRLVGGAQRFVDHGHPLEMLACGHVRRLPALGLLVTIMCSPCPVHPLFTRPAGQEPSSVLCGARATHGKVTATGPASRDLMSNSRSRRFPVTAPPLGVTRCQICHRTVAGRPGTLSGVLTGRSRRPILKRPACLPVPAAETLSAVRRCRHGPAHPGRTGRRAWPEDPSGHGAWPIDGEGPHVGPFCTAVASSARVSDGEQTG